jgi:hypothetical protein
MDSNVNGEVLEKVNSEPLRRIRIASALMRSWTTNDSLQHWRAIHRDGTPVEPAIAAPLQRYLREGQQLPAWADAQLIAEAEGDFFEIGPLSCLLLFCASLPECYVLPDLADVLHSTGQLEAHADYRVRSTASMIFPVMMKGGLTSPEGSGIAQILKVRLIHAMVRNLILRQSPTQALQWLQQESTGPQHGIVPTLHALREEANTYGRENATPEQRSLAMFYALIAHGWHLKQEGLPCNQMQLTYTLLTFHYVYLRSLHRLAIPFQPRAEQAYLHTWNVVGHILGIDTAHMPRNMAEAEALFKQMQAFGRAQPPGRQANGEPAPDPRPKLGQSLMAVMETYLPWKVVKPFPVLLTRELCGPDTARNIGIDGPVPIVSRFIYGVVMESVRAIDALGRVFNRDFCLTRVITDAIGYRAVTQFLLQQTRRLRLPDHLASQVQQMSDHWAGKGRMRRWVK